MSIDSRVHLATADTDVCIAGRRTTHGVEKQGPERGLFGHRLAVTTGAEPEGSFVEWYWDGDTLTVRNDRFGMYPLFYAGDGSGIRLSASLAQVLEPGVARELDFPALSVFLRLGFFIGNDTPFAGVRLLPAGSCLTWRPGELQIEEPPRAPPATVPDVRTFDEAVDSYAQAFARAIARRAPGDEPFVLPISGGRDSRHILFELLRQGHRPAQTFTVHMRPPSANEDIRIAGLLTAEFDLEHTEVEFASSHFAATRGELLAGDLCSGGHTWAVPVAEFTRNGAYGLAYDGIAGDVLSAGHAQSEKHDTMFRDGALVDLARELLGKSTAQLNLLAPDLARHVGDNVALERLVEDLQQHQHHRNPLMSWTFWNRTRRGIGIIPFRLLAHLRTVHCPFLDHEVFDLLINLDPAYAVSGKLHNETIRRAYPEYATIPYEDGKARRASTLADSAYYRRSLIDFIAYLGSRPSTLGSRTLRSKRVVLMTGRDLLTRQCRQPWYLHPSLYLLELERLANGA